MKNKVLCAMMSLLVFTSNMYAQCIESITYSDFDELIYSRPSYVPVNMACNASGVPYVVISDLNYDGKATVRKYVENKWITIGNAGFSDKTIYAHAQAIALDGEQNIFVAYVEDTKITVKKYNGISWNTIGTTGFATAMTTAVSIKVDKNGIPYICYGDSDNGNKINVKKFDGISWVSVGPANFSQGYILSPSIELDANDVPYVAYTDTGLNNFSYVKKYNGTSWVTVGNSSFAAASTSQPSFRIDKNGILYVAYSDDALPSKLYVKKFNGTSWLAVGAAVSPGRADYKTIALDADNAVYVAYEDVTTGNVVIKKYNGTSWVIFSNVGAENVIFRAIILFDANNVLHVLCQPLESDAKTCVYAYNGTSWFNKGTRGLSTGFSFNVDIASGTNGILYALYKEVFSSTTNSTIVKKYENGIWSNDLLSAAGINDPLLVVGTNNIPYIVYKDQLNLNKATVKKYNGVSWETLGMAGYGDGAIYSSIAADETGTVYAAYSVIANSSKCSVRKFNGTEWVLVGSPAFSEGTSYRPGLMLDKNNMPYVFYQDGAHEGKLTVMKYNGNDWVNVGMPGLSASEAQYSSLAFDTDNVPYLIYKDLGNDHKATIKKYNGNEWITLGSPISVGRVNYTSIALSGNDVPYVVFQDEGNQFKASVYKYDNNDWTEVTPNGLSAAKAEYTSIVFDRLTNTPYVAYNFNGSYVYQVDCGSDVTSIDSDKEDGKDFSVLVYPNPTSGMFILNLLSDASVVINNAYGQALLNTTMREGKHNMDLSSQPKGMYFINISYNKKIHSFKIIKD